MKRKMAIAAGFWLLLYICVNLLKRHAWIDTASASLIWLFVVGTVINYGIEIVRGRSASGRRTVLHNGYPRWFLRFAYGDEPAASSNKLRSQKGQSLYE
jgi:hypothetical protein